MSAPAWFRALSGLLGPGRLSRWLANANPPAAQPNASRKTFAQARMYSGSAPSRLTYDWITSTSSADAELVRGLRTLRNRSRALVRDNGHAKRARAVIQANVVGNGIGLQASLTNNRGRLVNKVNDGIEATWSDWCRARHCHIGGRLAFGDLERLLMGEVFEAGEVFIRLHRRAPGGGPVPLCLEVIEAERLADEYEIPVIDGNLVRQGVEVDRYHRPIAYWIHTLHPGDPRKDLGGIDRIERVPADQVIHLAVIERWPQTRGVPWMHAAIDTLRQLGEYEEAAVVAARIGASKVGFFTNPDGDLTPLADGEENGTPAATVEAGEFTSLPPGYDFKSWDPNYPTENYDDFTRNLLRGIAAAVGVSYESLTRDYSQSNYSSSRLALLEDRDLWRQLQGWFIRSFREELHRVWLEAAVLSGAVPAIAVSAYAAAPDRYQTAVRFKPRGWGWVDPAKEVNAYKEAELAGYITKADVIAATANGRDLEDVLNGRRRELDMLAALDLETDTTHQTAAPPQAPTTTPQPGDDDDEEKPAAAGRIVAFGRKRDHD